MKAETTRSSGERELEFRDSIVLPSTVVFSLRGSQVDDDHAHLQCL